jgi:hypothetical protein
VIYADSDSKPTFEIERCNYVEKAKKLVAGGNNNHNSQPLDQSFGEGKYQLGVP